MRLQVSSQSPQAASSCNQLQLAAAPELEVTAKPQEPQEAAPEPQEPAIQEPQEAAPEPQEPQEAAPEPQETLAPQSPVQQQQSNITLFHSPVQQSLSAIQLNLTHRPDTSLQRPLLQVSTRTTITSSYC
jgi:hypothetical protein